jgi:arsenate reductase (thioredoxin)
MQTADRLSVLFLCTGNSCRSQMAEGWTRSLYAGRIVAASAGTVAKGLDLRAVAVMMEAGVDICDQHSKTLDELRNPASGQLPHFDLVVTVCDAAHEACPAFSGGMQVVHRSFDDPPRLALATASEEDALGHYRRVRDEIREFITSLPQLLDRMGKTWNGVGE